MYYIILLKFVSSCKACLPWTLTCGQH